MLWLVTILFVATSSAFKVSVPASQIIAVRGQPTILHCEFTPHADLSSLVVTWQRQEDLRVVHSFYYQQDQLEKQSPDYQKRTSLFVSELGKGNASLKMEAVGPKDVGIYQCVVSNTLGTDKAQVHVKYGAFYTEPRLRIHHSCSSVMVRYETEGFPEPEVRWLGDQGQNLSHHTELIKDSEETVGLYYLQSSFIASSPALNITFILKNHLLNQDFQRSLNLTYGGDRSRCGVSSAEIGLAATCILMFFIIIALFIKLCQQLKLKRSPKVKYGSARRENGVEDPAG